MFSYNYLVSASHIFATRPEGIYRAITALTPTGSASLNKMDRVAA